LIGDAVAGSPGSEGRVEALRVYRGLLANRPLTKLLLGEFISGIGDWLYIVAIFVVIYQETQHLGETQAAAAVGLFGAIRMVPYILLSIPAGLVADRFDRRLVLLTSDLLRGSCMVVLFFLVGNHAPIPLIVAVAMLAASGSTFFYPAIGAYLPALAADERQLGPANSAWASLGNVSFIIGPAIGGLLIAAGGLDAAFILNAASFTVIAFILWTLPPSIAGKTAPGAAAASDAPAADVPAGDAPTIPAEALAGIATAEPTATAADAAPAAAVAPAAAAAAATASIPVTPMVGLGLIQVIVGFLDGGIQALTIILAVTVLNAGEQANGYLNAAIGVGGLIGAVVSGVLVLRRRMSRPLLAGAFLTGAGVAVLGIIPILGVALVAIGISAGGSIVLDVILTTIFQRLVPDALRGRTLGLLMTANTISAAAGAFVMPIAVTVFGAALALTAAGTAVFIGAILGLGLIGAAASRAASPFEATLALVAKLPLFAGVSASRLEAALSRVRPIEVVAGQRIVEQGEPSDRFYIIESGAFTVSQINDAGGETELRRLGPDEVFGEIGLLNQSARTATVTADAPGRLLEMDGDDFLELVGAGGDLRGRLLGLYGSAGGSRTG
jgi:MFS family permease